MSDEAIGVILFRPVGQREFELVRDANFTAFPPRLLHQPIFYPLLNEEYAVQIARDWNTKDSASGYARYVLRFMVRKAFIQKYQIQKVGDARALEYWIPADELDEFNANIMGNIEVVAHYTGNP